MSNNSPNTYENGDESTERDIEECGFCYRCFCCCDCGRNSNMSLSTSGDSSSSSSSSRDNKRSRKRRIKDKHVHNIGDDQYTQECKKQRK